MFRSPITKIVAVLTISALSLWATIAPADMMKVTGLLAGDSLNVRTSPSGTSADIGDIQEGAIINVLGTNAAGTWSQIRYRGQLAWVSSSYLADIMRHDGSALVTGPHVVAGIPANDADGGLVIRDGAGTGFPALGVLPNGTPLHIIRRTSDGKWGMIGLANGVGWVSTHYLVGANQGGGAATVNRFPLGLTCRGTEPHWTLTIADDRSVQYNSLINGPEPLVSLTQTTPAAGGGYPFDFWAQSYAGTLDAQTCSDGMSDIAYSMSLILTKPRNGGGVETLYGCCNMN